MDLRFKFNEDETNYEKIRPLYPQELFKDILAYNQLDQNSHALEIGIGTGQATLPILTTQAQVIAVELGDKLSEFVRNKFWEYPNFEVINADFMELSFNPHSLDLVYSATAFHWLPEDKSYTKVYEILKPKGAIALFWNHPYPNRKDDPTNCINMQVYDHYRPSNQPQIEFSEKDCEKRVKDLIRYGFQDVQYKLYHRVRTLTSDQYIALLNTYSDHRALAPEIKVAFEQEMKSSLDKIGGYINIYDTIDLYLARK